MDRLYVLLTLRQSMQAMSDGLGLGWSYMRTVAEARHELAELEAMA